MSGRKRNVSRPQSRGFHGAGGLVPARPEPGAGPGYGRFECGQDVTVHLRDTFMHGAEFVWLVRAVVENDADKDAIDFYNAGFKHKGESCLFYLGNAVRRRLTPLRVLCSSSGARATGNR